MDDALPFERAEIEASIGERFERVVRRFPDRPAVRQAGRLTSYAELDALAGRFASALSTGPADRAAPVALLLDPSAPLFAAMLGALRARRFYVPLDPRLPAPRLRSVLAKLDAAVLIADAPRLEQGRGVAPSGTRVRAAEEIAAHSPEAAASGVHAAPDDLAYVLFTSGSTGAPKGVMQSHRNVLHNVRKLTTALSIRADDRLTLLSSVGVGASVSDIFGALLNGAAVCPHSLAGDGLRRLPELLTRERITIYHSVPSVFRSLASTLDGREDLSALRAVRLGGEPVFASDFGLYRNRFPRSCRFHVGLGATEMNVIRHWSAGHDTAWPGGSPLGYAVDETEVVLLDEAGCETDGTGEIAVRARTLALGYWKDPVQTAAAFSPVPERPGVRLFRSGDLGRMLPDGLLLHRGRRDERLKVRGHRVEPGEVEEALLAVPGVFEAAVGGLQRPEGTRLVAWLVRRPQEPPEIPDLRRALLARLPEPMVPTAFVFLAALPRTASGKVDRRALPDPGASRPPLARPPTDPEGPAEEAVVAAFREALELEPVGADDDFFELGGDSLSAVEALAIASDRLGVELSAVDLLEAPTPRGLAARALSSGVRAPGDPIRIQDGDGVAVFVVPGGAGDSENLFAARRIATRLGGGHPFFCFRPGEVPHPAVPELATRFIRQMRAARPHGPHALVGDCVGGIVAFAMASRLRAEGDPPALLALLDTPFPTPKRRRRGWLLRRAPGLHRVLGRLGYFRERLAYHSGVLHTLRRGRIAYGLRAAAVGIRGLLPAASERRRRAQARRASYVGTLLAWPPARYDGRVLLVESEGSAREGFGEAWRRLAADARIVRVPGDHAGFILEQGDSVASALRAELETLGVDGRALRRPASEYRG